MNYLELQQRANVLVTKVNEYENNLTGVTINETETLDQHLYADLFCLRPVLKLLFGSTVTDKLSRTLLNDADLKLFASSAPAWNTKFNIFDKTIETDSHDFIQNIDMINSHNMLQLDVQQNTLTERDDRIRLGINYSYSSNIQDALVTESQVANVFKWNTTTTDSTRNNSMTINRQVPGIVCYYLGNEYNGAYTATIPYNPSTSTINAVNYSTPSYYGAYYIKNNQAESQVGYESDHEACRIFYLGCTYTRGVLTSPQQIWQPDRIVGDSNTSYGYNWQGQGLYHELVFKNRRSGAEEAGVDFVPALDSVPDNDPQGLATRLVLAKQKDYYYNRPWFDELDSLYSKDTSALADIVEQSQTITSDESTTTTSEVMTDTEYYNTYKLDYKTYAENTDQPL